MHLHHCLCCGGDLPASFLDLGNTPLANSYLPPEKACEPEFAAPLAVSFCEKCYLVQLTHLVPPADLFTDYLYFSSYSESYLAHARSMTSDLIQRFGLHSSSRVVEVASNDGYQLQYFQSEGIPVLGIEPAKNIAAVARQKGIPTVDEFFSESLVPEILASFGSADVLIGNNVLAHVPQIRSFLTAVRGCLSPDGYAVFEFPYVKDLLDHCEFDTIYHEHVFYYSLSSIRSLANAVGLSLADVEHQSVHGGSLRVFLSKAPQPSSAAVVAMLEAEETAGLTDPFRYQQLARTVTNLRDDLLELLRSLKSAGNSIAAYGAPAKGNTLLNYCGIGSNIINFTVDRNPHKQRLLLPGSRIPIREPQALLEEMPDYVLILPWNLADEIISQQQEYVRRGGRLIVPVPTPHIVGEPAWISRVSASAAIQ